MLKKILKLKETIDELRIEAHKSSRSLLVSDKKAKVLADASGILYGIGNQLEILIQKFKKGGVK